jgi:cyanophycinase
LFNHVDPAGDQLVLHQTDFRMSRILYSLSLTLIVILLATSSVAAQSASIGLAGNPADVETSTQGGVVLMGGSTDVDEAFRWMIERSGGGDFIILRAGGSTGYNEYVFNLGTVHSVETLLIDSREKAMDSWVGRRIREAEAVFIAGGDQWNYVNYWTDSEVASALHYLIHEKKIPVGGTSAGCAVLSDMIFDARHDTVLSGDALKNPYDQRVSIRKSFIRLPFLQDVISDQHYSQRGREGRHVTFLARMKIDWAIKQPRGIGVDEKTAVCVDASGGATVFGSGRAYFLEATGSNPEVCEDGKPLTWNSGGNAIKAFIVPGSSNGTHAFNLNNWSALPTSEWWWTEKGELKRGKS